MVLLCRFKKGMVINMGKRVFLIVLDSFGIGYLPDAAEFGDYGANTLASCMTAEGFALPTLKKMGLFNIDGVNAEKEASPTAAFCRAAEKSRGKDTTVGHWEIGGLISKDPLPTYPEGFPEELIKKYSELTGRKILCNEPYSGTKLLEDYGREHVQSGALLVYTSADSVFQVAAHEEVVPLSELYRYCEIAREMLVGEHGVGRVIARPFVGEYPNFKRTANRHDYSLKPPKKTMLDHIKASSKEVIGVGKISDIFADVGITSTHKTKNNMDGVNKLVEIAKTDFDGLCFVNLVDFDMLYGHRNDIKGYANALMEFDTALTNFLPLLKAEDLLIITADHGCDPGYDSTDHTREYIPVIFYGENVKAGANLGTLPTFADIGSTVMEYLDVSGDIDGESRAKDLLTKS